MVRYSFFILILFLPYLSFAQAALAQNSHWLAVPFYAQEVRLQYTAEYLPDTPDHVEENNLYQWYQQIKEQNTASQLLKSLQLKKQQLNLNDWLYYELVRQTSIVLFPENQLQQRLFNWYLLSESGYDTRLTFLDHQVYLYAYIEEGIFDTPMIQENSKHYVNLSGIHDKMENPSTPLNMLSFEATPYGKAFSFDLRVWPKLSATTKKIAIAFNWQQEHYSFTIAIDQTVAQFMKNYPVFEEKQYLETPLSPTLQQSLLPPLREIIAGKSKKEALEILVAFTRSAFAYQEDRISFGKNKPMIADELFHYPYSDCEDRSALFYNLVKSLLDLPMIIIAYPNHLTIGVALEEAIGPAIRYQGKSYYICDPTGPANSEKIGLIPAGYEKTSFEILGHYR